MNYREKTAERLSELRKEKNFTQKELAEMVDTSPQNIDLYESGKRKINVEILGKIADVFNVSTDYLLGRSDAMSMDTDIQTACKVTGLKENTIKSLMIYSNGLKVFCPEHTQKTIVNALEVIINSNFFLSIVCNCADLLETTEELTKDNFFILSMNLSEIQKKYDCDTEIVDVLPKIFSKKFSSEKANNVYKLSENSDLCRYKITKNIEEISNLFDKRLKIYNLSKEDFQKYVSYFIDNNE